MLPAKVLNAPKPGFIVAAVLYSICTLFINVVRFLAILVFIPRVALPGINSEGV
ncbi:MAG: hypothetical protein QW700_06010 [Desulfurococcaceae archaeon]